MLRDITLTLSVLMSIVSLMFGVYKNIEAGNAEAFAYEQAYRILGIVNESNIGTTAKASILESALGSFGVPAPVINFSRSSADAPISEGACAEDIVLGCLRTARQIADLNTACAQSKGSSDVCRQAEAVAELDVLTCMTCFRR